MVCLLCKSLRGILVTLIVFALVGLAATTTSVLAGDGPNPLPDCDGMNLEYCLRNGRDSGPTPRIPVSGGAGNDQILDRPIIIPDYCRWGIIYEQSPVCQAVESRLRQKNTAIPVTGVSVDFSTMCRLVVEPAAQNRSRFSPGPGS